jgi:hypothetical protein
MTTTTTHRELLERLARLALERSLRASNRDEAVRALAHCQRIASAITARYSIDADNGSVLRRYVAHVATMTPDELSASGRYTIPGDARGDAIERPTISGASKSLPQPNVPLAHSASKVTGGSGKRRRSYEVTQRHERYYVDADGVRHSARSITRAADAMLAVSASYDLVSPVTGRTIEALPDGARLRMVGTDMGLSWQSVVSAPAGTDPRVALAVTEQRHSQRSAISHYLGSRVSVGCDGIAGDRTLGAPAPTLATWPLVTSVGSLTPRTGEIASVTVANPFRSAGMPAVLTVTSLPAPTGDPERAYYGHGSSLPRPAVRGKNSKRDEQRERERAERVASETVGYVDAIADAFYIAADSGAPMAVALPNGLDVRVTVGPSGVASVTITRDGEQLARMKSRTARAVARRVASIAG